MQQIAVDTNIILDTLLERSGIRLFEDLLKKSRQGKLFLYIPYIVFFEIEWILRSFYKKDKVYIIQLLRALLSIRNLETKNMPFLIRVVDIFEKESVSFVDACMLEEIKNKGVDQFETEDKKLKTLFMKVNTEDGV